jgi:hypothetical protein
MVVKGPSPTPESSDSRCCGAAYSLPAAKTRESTPGPDEGTHTAPPTAPTSPLPPSLSLRSAAKQNAPLPRRAASSAASFTTLARSAPAKPCDQCKCQFRNRRYQRLSVPTGSLFGATCHLADARHVGGQQAHVAVHGHGTQVQKCPYQRPISPYREPIRRYLSPG